MASRRSASARTRTVVCSLMPTSTGTCPAAASSAVSSTRSRSASVRYGTSPEDPSTKMPCTPPATRWSTRAEMPAGSISPESVRGVSSGGMIPWKSVMVVSLLVGVVSCRRGGHGELLGGFGRVAASVVIAFAVECRRQHIMVTARPEGPGEQREEVAEDPGAEEGDGRHGERSQSGLPLDDPGQARAEDERAEDTGGVRALREDAEREHPGQGHAEEPGDRQEQIPGLDLIGGREVERDRDGQDADDDDDGA